MSIASAASFTEVVQSRTSAKRWRSVSVIRRRVPVGRGVSGLSVKWDPVVATPVWIGCCNDRENPSGLRFVVCPAEGDVSAGC